MAKAHGKNSRVLFNDDHVSGDITGWSWEHRRNFAEVTTLLSTGEQWIPGQFGGRVTLRGLFDTASSGGSFATEADEVRATNDGMLITILPEGLTVGTNALIASGTIESRSLTSAVKDAVALEVQGQPNDGVDWGVCLHGVNSESATGNAASVDNTTSSANGGVASMHVVAYSGTATFTVKVQHSVDNSVWADLTTFTSFTGETQERKTVTGTVNRYVRASWTVTGSGSAQFAVAFARR